MQPVTRSLFLSVLVLIGLSSQTNAQNSFMEEDLSFLQDVDVEKTPLPPKYEKSITTSLGFTSDPDTVLLGLGADFEIEEHTYLGPLLQIGVDDDFTLFAPTLNLKRTFAMTDPDLTKLEPFVHGGIGFAYLDEDNRPGDDDDLGLLLNFGLGANYFVSKDISIGSNLMFNFLPAEVLDERFFFSWQVIGISFHF